MTDLDQHDVSVGQAPPRMGPRELLVFLAMSSALVALGIDIMLPALDEIRDSFGYDSTSTSVNAVVPTYFLGLGLGTLVYGPLADRFGRRKTLLAGLVVYILGSLATAFSPNLQSMLLARVLWGVGAAGPRTVAFAIVRDRFEGDAMAKAMSTIFAIFLTLPVVAPSIGAGILRFTSWRGVFASCGIVAIAIGLWSIRLAESLRAEDRLPNLSVRQITTSVKIVVSNRATLALTVAVGIVFGPFTSYIGTSELIFSDILGAEDSFPILFGVMAASMGVFSLVGGQIVDRIGSRVLLRRAVYVYVAATGAFLVVAGLTDGRPGLIVFMVSVAAISAVQTIVLPNCNTQAMQPLGQVAGTAASVIGATQSILGAILAAIIDQTYNGTIIPLAVAFLIAGICVNVLVRYAQNRIEPEIA